MGVQAPVTRRPRPVHVAFAGLLTLGVGAQPAAQSAAPARWQISSMRIAAAGRTTAGDDGRHVVGVVFEGRARAARGAFAFDTGILRLTLSGFSPAASSEDRRAGDWQLEGTWVITPASGAPVVIATSRSRGVTAAGPSLDADPAPSIIRGTLTGVCSNACFWPFRGVVRATDTLVNGRSFAEVLGTFEGRADATALLVIGPR